MSAAPSVCPCRWCGEKYEPAGITNHETHCPESPHPGVPVEKQKELGIYEEPDESKAAGDDPAAPADDHPDQRSASTDGGRLPPREELPQGDSSPDHDPEPDHRCPSCESDDTIPSHDARELFRERMESVPDGLITTMDATDRYCNQCFTVWGGELDEPHRITEGSA